MKSERKTVRKGIIEALKAAPEIGFGADDIRKMLGVKAASVTSSIKRMLATGLLWRVGSHFEARYFGSQNQADGARAALAVWRAERRAAMVALAAERRRRHLDLRKRQTKTAPSKLEHTLKKKVAGKTTTRAPFGPSDPIAGYAPGWTHTIHPCPPDPCKSNTHARSW